jgi:hypothetical protein
MTALLRPATLLLALAALAAPATLRAADVPQWRELFNGRDLTGWIDVNTSPDTWKVRDGLLVCRGQPIGVMRSDKQYENFILRIEWRHMEPGGNSGIFLWSDGTVPEGKRLPKGMEVQMLELEWPLLNRTPDGKPRPLAYVHGELFGAGGLVTVPDNPRGNRSMSWENRCLGKGEWNTYDVVAVDGVVKLSVNGKFVNGVSQASQRKGYLCLESEGAEIHFRRIAILELPPGRATPEQTAPVVGR